MIGERWTLLIVRDAFFGVRRFSDFQAHLDIPRAVLWDRKPRTQVDGGVLARRPDPQHAGRQLYDLTGAGGGLLAGSSSTRCSSGEAAGDPNSRVFSHAPCGTRLDDAGRCRPAT